MCRETIRNETKLSAVFVLRHVPKCCIFHTDKLGSDLIDILYFLKLNRLVSMRTYFCNLRPSLKLMLPVKFLAEQNDFLLHHAVISFCRWAEKLLTVGNFTSPLKLFNLAAIDIRGVNCLPRFLS